VTADGLTTDGQTRWQSDEMAAEPGMYRWTCTACTCRIAAVEKLTLTTLRHRLFEVADRVIETGVAVAITRRGKTLLLAPQATTPKLARLKRRKLITGAPSALVNAKAGTWREPRNLR
jgi:hypothetical protein